MLRLFCIFLHLANVPFASSAVEEKCASLATGSYDITIKLRDATIRDAEKTLLGHSKPVYDVAFSPDGRRIVSGSYDQTIKLWNTTTGEVEETLVGHSDTVFDVAFSPNGR